MRHGLAPTLLPALILVVAGLALGALLFRGSGDGPSRADVQADSVDHYRQLWRGAQQAAAYERERADSAAAAARESVDTVRVAIPRWRERVVVDTLRVSEPGYYEEVYVPRVQAAYDSLAVACERAADDCEAALDARDRELAAADSAQRIMTDRVERLEAYRDELADELRKSTGWRRTVREVAIGTLGGLAGYGVCSISGG